MVTGFFLARDGWRGTVRFIKKTAVTYLAAIALYLPLNIYNGFFTPLELLQRVLIEGTMYHLWYFPALILGVLIARELSRLGRWALPVACILYLIGLGGDSYYGLASSVPTLKVVYGTIFAVSPHTRNVSLWRRFLSCWGPGRAPRRAPPTPAWRCCPSSPSPPRGCGCAIWAGRGTTACILPCQSPWHFSFQCASHITEGKTWWPGECPCSCTYSTPGL